MVKPFNKSLTHATVHGDGRFAFQQNGILYTHDGTPVDVDGNPLPLDKEESAEQALGDPAAKQPRGRKKPNTQDLDPEAAQPDEEEEIDLAGWRDGTVPYPWPTVVAAIQRKHDVVVNTKAEAMEVLAAASAAK